MPVGQINKIRLLFRPRHTHTHTSHADRNPICKPFGECNGIDGGNIRNERSMYNFGTNADDIEANNIAKCSIEFIPKKPPM